MSTDPAPDEVPSASPRGGHPTRQQGEDRRLRVAQLQRMKARPGEMAKELGVSKRTITNDLRILRAQVKEWYFEQAKGDLAASHKLSIEVLEERQRKAMLFEGDKNLRPMERMAATQLIAELEVQIWNMLPYTKALMEGLVGERPKKDAIEDDRPETE